MIPQCDLLGAYRIDQPAIDLAILRVMSSGRYILGPEVEAFEKEFAAWLGVDHAVGVANGTDAIVLALKAVGVKPGDAVFTVSHTVSATVAAVELCGATPVYIDIEPQTCTMSTKDLAETLAAWPGGRIGAILPVHIYGQPCDLWGIHKIAAAAGIPVVDDCAHALGAWIGMDMIGAIADASTFSFYPTKNLGAFGDGGMVTTNSPEVAHAVRELREYGWGPDHRYISTRRGGTDSRLDELQAAILRARLPRLADRVRTRLIIAERYDGIIDLHPSLRSLWTPDGCASAAHLYVVFARNRQDFEKHLTACGVSMNIHYPVPVHLQPAYRDRVRLGPSGCRVSEALAHEVASVPLYPEMTAEQVNQVCEALATYGG